uniref:CooT family nickel-binding protein n=1 Tax=Meloidogyne javanica TaxID=6303 RepID=A0A915N1K4_MELJA
MEYIRGLLVLYKGIKEIIIEGEESQHGVETLIINGELKTIVINEEFEENRVIVSGKEIVEKKCVHNFDLNELSKEAKEAKGIVD